eukprot:jgi/Chlat1/6961/Chrsp52S06647
MDRMSQKTRQSVQEAGGSPAALKQQMAGAGMPRQSRRMSNSNSVRYSTRSSVRSSRRSVATSKRGKTDNAYGGTQAQVFDENGVDVTPRPLQPARGAGPARGGPGQMPSGEATPNSDLSDMLDRLSTGFRSGMSATASESGSFTPEALDEDSGAEGGDLSTPRADGGMEGPTSGQGGRKTEVLNESDLRVLTAADLDRPVYLTLQETETFMLMDMPSVCVLADSAESVEVMAVNTRYKKMLARKEGSENFVDTGVQTLNTLCKNKEVQSRVVLVTPANCQASSWDIHDSFAAVEATDSVDGADGVDTTAVSTTNAAVGQSVSQPAATGSSMDINALSGGGSSSMVGGSMAVSRTAEQSMAMQYSSVVVASEPEKPNTNSANALALGGDAAEPGPVNLSQLTGLPRALQVMERAVTQNNYNDKLLQYRNHRTQHQEDNILETSLRAPHRSLEVLWNFSCDLTKGRNVSCMAWNAVKCDLLAVGYGQFEFGPHVAGLVAFWSLQNPTYPEWSFSTRTGVTALHFCKSSPNLLGVGLKDGTVGVWDVRGGGTSASAAKPMVESGGATGKHLDPVWALSWVDMGHDRPESLVSVSSDGRLTLWSLKKGLECSDLMKLKRVGARTAARPAVAPAPGAAGAPAPRVMHKSEAFISRKASGMCFHFSRTDPSIYLAGTEEGNIHKCSTSYSEQYLQTYFGHAGPVYQVRWSPFAKNYFLSASADWTIKLWKDEQDDALLTFQCGTDAIADCQWSPFNSTVFGTATTSGRVEIWDVEVSVLRPVLSTTVSGGGALSCLLFGTDSPIVVAGGQSGAVSVFRMVGIAQPEQTPEQQAARLESVMSANSANTSI